MENEILNKIIAFATTELNQAYGYCGSAVGPEAAMLNSEDRKGKDIKIIITLKDEEI